MADCNCPDDGMLKEISQGGCAFDMKQIQKLIFVTQGKVIWDSEGGGGAGDGVPNLIGQLDTEADWLARRTAIDDTKAVITPFIGADPIIAAGEVITSGGGDNSTLNGIAENVGVNPSVFTAVFKSLSPEQEKALKDITCKSVEVYFVTENGSIIASKIDDSERRRGFIVEGKVFVGDRNNGGFATKDTNAISFSLSSGWSEDLVKVTPVDFNALLDLDEIV